MKLPADPRFDTGRLSVRLVEEADLPAILAMNADDEVTRYLPYDAWRGMDDAQAWYGRAAARREAGEALQFAMIERAGGRLVGTCLLFHFDEPSARGEVGYLLGREHWGAGYMQEAGRALIRFAFDTLGLRRLEAEIDPRNTASARLLERLGFVREGLLRERWDLKGEVSDSGLYGLLRKDWLAA